MTVDIAFEKAQTKNAEGGRFDLFYVELSAEHRQGGLVAVFVAQPKCVFEVICLIHMKTSLIGSDIIVWLKYTINGRICKSAAGKKKKTSSIELVFWLRN